MMHHVHFVGGGEPWKRKSLKVRGVIWSSDRLLGRHGEASMVYSPVYSAASLGGDTEDPVTMCELEV